MAFSGGAWWGYPTSGIGTPMEVEYAPVDFRCTARPLTVVKSDHNHRAIQRRDRERDHIRPSFGSRTPPPSPRPRIEEEIENINRRISGVVDILITTNNAQRALSERVDNLYYDLERLRLE